MKTTKFITEHDARIAEYKAIQAKKDEVKKEHYTKVIESENQLTEVSNLFLDFLAENEAKLKGKKLYIQTGKSKFFESFLTGFNGIKGHVFACYIHGSNLNLRASVNGGSYEDKTYYCQYIDRTLYDVIKTDNNGVFESIRTEKSGYKTYDYSSYAAAIDNIKELKAQIKAIEAKISIEKSAIPYSLQDELRYL